MSIAELHRDLFQHIFDYLTISQLFDLLRANLIPQILEYIDRRKSSINWGFEFNDACGEGNIEYAKFSLERMDRNRTYLVFDDEYNFGKIIEESCEDAAANGHQNIVELLIGFESVDIHQTLVVACGSGNLSLVEFIMKIAEEKNIKFSYTFPFLFGAHHPPIANYIIKFVSRDELERIAHHYLCEKPGSYSVPTYNNTLRLIQGYGIRNCFKCGRSIEDHLIKQ